MTIEQTRENIARLEKCLGGLPPDHENRYETKLHIAELRHELSKKIKDNTCPGCGFQMPETGVCPCGQGCDCELASEEGLDRNCINCERRVK